METTEMGDYCTCPCIDCIEGRHCGSGGYEIDDKVVGVCLEPPQYEDPEGQWPEEWGDEDEDEWEIGG
jgi:hypothetical protein